MNLRASLGLGLLASLPACGSTTAATPDAAPDIADATPADVATDAAPADVAPADVAPSVRDIAYAAPPRSALVEPGVRREVFYVDAPAPAPNPTTHTATPAELDRVQVIRYRVDAPAAAPVRAVIVAMPGFLGGAGSFDPLARALVRRGARAATPVEVWSIDRRSNLLEDLRGMDVADAMRDPELAVGYYVNGDLTIGGRAFEGYRSASDARLAFMSEWGLAATVNDLRAVIARIPASRAHAVLVGHSLGATIAESYAAWDFDGTGGYRSIAGLVLVDGVASGASATEAAWRDGGAGGPGGFGNAGVASLRASGPWFTALPVLGVRALAVSEIVARRATLAPDAVVDDPERDAIFRLLLGVTQTPPLTNAAAMGIAFDDTSCPLAFARMSTGSPTGGPLRRQANLFDAAETLTVPDSTTATYRWIDAPTSSPREFTPVANAAAAWAATPTNFGEWYFPTRLSLDTAAVGNLALAADAWQVREGIRTTRGREIDVPVLGISAGLVTSAAAFDRVRDRVAPAVGADLPAAGATRANPAAFRAFRVARMTHLDPLTGADDNPDNPVPEAVLSFAAGATAGTVTPTP